MKAMMPLTTYAFIRISILFLRAHFIQYSVTEFLHIHRSSLKDYMFGKIIFGFVLPALPQYNPDIPLEQAGISARLPHPNHNRR